MKSLVMMTTSALFLAQSALAETPALRPDQQAFRAIYQELVETDTSITTHSVASAGQWWASGMVCLSPRCVKLL